MRHDIGVLCRVISVRLGLWLVCAFTINFWVFGLNHLMWPLKLKLFANTFTWYYLSILCVLYDRPSRRNLLGNRFFLVYSYVSLLELCFSKGTKMFFYWWKFLFHKRMLIMLFSQSEHWNKNKETSTNRTTRGYFKILRYSLPLEYKLYYLQFFFI